MTITLGDDERRRLLNKQLELALSGNVAMLIWLGKQYLDQVDVTTGKLHT